MDKTYEPRDLQRLEFEELKRFFRSGSEINNFLDNEESMFLTWYFTQSEPAPDESYDPRGRSAFIQKMYDELGRMRGEVWYDWPYHWGTAMTKLRARQRCLVVELEGGIDTSQMKTFLPWHEWPRGPRLP